MHVEMIKANLRMKGVTPTALADELRVANSTVSQVLSGRSVSTRIRRRIAEIIGLPVDELWPPSDKPVLRRSKKVIASNMGRRA